MSYYYHQVEKFEVGLIIYLTNVKIQHLAIFSQTYTHNFVNVCILAKMRMAHEYNVYFLVMCRYLNGSSFFLFIPIWKECRNKGERLCSLLQKYLMTFQLFRYIPSDRQNSQKYACKVYFHIDTTQVDNTQIKFSKIWKSGCILYTQHEVYITKAVVVTLNKFGRNMYIIILDNHITTRS